MSFDALRPRNDPARAIYDAFQAEALLRHRRDLDEACTKERQAVHRAACEYAKSHGWSEPKMLDVQQTELYARGSADYGATWAYALARRMAVEQLTLTVS